MAFTLPLVVYASKVNIKILVSNEREIISLNCRILTPLWNFGFVYCRRWLVL